MNFEFQKTKTSISILIALIVITFMTLIVRCYDSICGDIELGRDGGYAIDFHLPQLDQFLVTFIVIFGITYSIWSLFQPKK